MFESQARLFYGYLYILTVMGVFPQLLIIKNVFFLINANAWNDLYQDLTKLCIGSLTSCFSRIAFRWRLFEHFFFSPIRSLGRQDVSLKQYRGVIHCRSTISINNFWITSTELLTPSIMVRENVSYVITNK